MIGKSGKWQRYDIMALLIILILNIALKWRFFCGLVEADDFSYGVYAFSLFKIPLTWDMNMDFRVLRLSFILPVASLFRILPATELTAVLMPFAASVGTVVLAFFIARKLYGVHAGIFAAFVLATFPADVIYGTMLLPDILVPFYLALTVWAFIHAVDDKEEHPAVWFVVSGFAMFLAFVARENSYWFLLFFIPWAFGKKQWSRGLYLSGVAFTILVVSLYGFYYIKSGDFLFNLHLAQHFRDPLIESGYIPDNAKNWFVFVYMMLPILYSKIMGRLILASGLFGYIFYIGVPAVFYTAWRSYKKKDWNGLIMPWWFLVVYLYLDFGTISFSHYQMMRKLDRFLLTLTPAMAVCVGVALTDIFGLGNNYFDDFKAFIKKLKQQRGRLAGSAITIIIMLLVLATSYQTIKFQKLSRDRNMLKFRWANDQIFADSQVKRIYTTGGWWKNKLSFFMMPDLAFAEMPWRHSDSLLDLKGTTPNELAGSHVVIDRTHFTGENDLRVRHSYDDFGTFVRVPPKEWKLLGSKHRVEIYEVPENWTYKEPDAVAFLVNALNRGIETGDVSMIVSVFHPDLLKTLDQSKFNDIVGRFSSNDPTIRKQIIDKMLFKEDQDKRIKIDFNK